MTIAAVVMGLLIVSGTATLLVLLARQVPALGGSDAALAAPSGAVLDEPAGTRIAGAAGSAEALVLRLQGGGPDRVLVLDARTGRVLGRAGLAR